VRLQLSTNVPAICASVNKNRDRHNLLWPPLIRPVQLKLQHPQPRLRRNHLPHLINLSVLRPTSRWSNSPRNPVLRTGSRWLNRTWQSLLHLREHHVSLAKSSGSSSFIMSNSGRMVGLSEVATRTFSQHCRNKPPFPAGAMFPDYCSQPPPSAL
jgi:hypothetical protein